MMKKLIAAAAALSILAGASAAFAAVDRVPGPWDLTGTYGIALTCTSGCVGTFDHTMNVTAMDTSTGDFSGNGSYDANNAYTWDVTGNVSDSAVTFTLVYTGLNPGFTVNATGTIAADGTMSGTASASGGQTFTWETTSGAASRFTGNHGQYVSSQTDKQSAAHSDIGMPVQSGGPTP